MATDAQKKASRKYNLANTKNIQFRLNLKTDADIIEHLESQPNKMRYFKDLIRADIEAKTNGRGS